MLYLYLQGGNMTKKNTNVILTFDTPTVTLLNMLAKQEDKSVSNFAQDLILEALELREDMDLSLLAQIRDTKDEPLVGHDEAWK
jgi:hypothetical protein